MAVVLNSVARFCFLVGGGFNYFFNAFSKLKSGCRKKQCKYKMLKLA